MQHTIYIRGAREHNLKNITVEIPRNKLVVITGVSGSGKSSLAFNTLYAEGQRRYVESLSTYARQFIGQMDKPQVDSIEGLAPAIAIEQKTVSKNPRSTVGTVTEIYDFYRLLYARIGVPYDPDTGKPLTKQTIDEILTNILSFKEGTRVTISAPVVKLKKGSHKKVFDDAKKLGFTRAYVNGKLTSLSKDIPLGKNHKHDIEIICGRVLLKDSNRLQITEAFEKAMEMTNGSSTTRLQFEDGSEKKLEFSLHYTYKDSSLSVQELEPQLFSFNSPSGYCQHCLGIGYTTEFDEKLVVPDINKSFAQRAVAPISENWKWYNTLIQAYASSHNVSLTDPFSAWPESVYKGLLYGSDELYEMHWESEYSTRKMKRNFPGIIPDLSRRFASTSDQSFREWLSKFTRQQVCHSCKGGRLRKESLHVRIQNIAIQELSHMSIGQSIQFFNTLQFTEREKVISKEILKEITERLHFLQEVGLEYLTLDRYAGTLSGGESQRIRLASQIGSGLVGVLYVLDEPTIGLHQKDNERLLSTLVRLRDLGNTVVMVEHDEQAIQTADFVLDMGPKAGKNGGDIVGQGTPEEIARLDTLTGHYIRGTLCFPRRKERRTSHGKAVTIKGARQNNLQNIDVSFPLSCMTVITGVSGSGKSTLMQEILYPALHNTIYRSTLRIGDYDAILGHEVLDKIVDINQSPIGRTPRSNPCTYVKIFQDIRDLFAQLPESRARGYKAGRFSFNVKGGRCEACQGAGTQLIEMNFLSDVYITCDVCKGKRYNYETLQIEYKGKNITDILNLTIDEASDFFQTIPTVARKLKVLQDVGMGYIALGQAATTLSGGEAQRIKLALELSKVSTGKTLYLLDEPTTGLHQADVIKLLEVLHELVNRGNTVVLIEHNLEVIGSADYIIDLGPDGGDRGGKVLCCGTPEEVAKVKNSYTGRYIKAHLSQ